MGLLESLSKKEGELLGWDKEHQARKKQREARDKFASMELPEFEQYGDLSLDQYSAVPELANFEAQLGDIYTAGPAREALSYLANPEYAQGTYATQEREGTVGLGDTEMQGIALDPDTRAAQMQALEGLSGMTTDGMTGAERARLDLINARAGTAARGARDALSTEMARRGMSGSGLELFQKQMANQSAAEAARLQGLEAQAMAQNRQMQALQSLGNLGGSIRGQDYGIEADRARAQDAINQWNAANSQGVMGRNAGAANDMAKFNAGVANNMSQFNAGVGNANQQFNANMLANTSQYNAGAANDMAKFNAGQQQAGSFSNANMANDFGFQKAGALQNIANANTGLKNDMNQWNQQGKLEANNALKQQGFSNNFSKQSGVMNQQNAIAAGIDAAGKSRKTDTMAIGDAATKLGFAAAGAGAGSSGGMDMTKFGANMMSQNMTEDERKRARGTV